MEFGIHLPHTGRGASPEAIRAVCQVAEGLGFDGLWTVDHLALPRRTSSLYTLTREPMAMPEGRLAQMLNPMYECLTTLTYAAALTKRVKLGTSVLVLPIRNPVANARQLATLDVLSGGRLLLGVGAAWLKEEAEAMHMPWDRRGARTEEHMALLRTLWTATEPYVSFQGRFYSFQEISPEPRPAQPCIPLLIGGHSEAAKARAGRVGDGWISTGLPPEVQASSIAQIKEIAAQHGRDPQRLIFVGSIRLRPGSPAEAAERIRAYQGTGTHHLILWPEVSSPGELMEAMQWLAKEVLPEFRPGNPPGEAGG